jgi:AmmeMemoRadiSam system protein B
LARPQLRAISPEWTQHEGRRMLLLRDHLRLTENGILVPPHVVQVLALFDGQRDRARIRQAYQQQTGNAISASDLDHLIGQLDDLLLLVSPRSAAAYQAALAAYRAAPFRPPALAGRVYPAEPKALAAQLAGWVAEAVQRLAEPTATRQVKGVVSPHIDYGRGAEVYADVWLPAVTAVQEADLIIVFGTDHHGSAGSVTPTYQRYATPLGVLPNDTAVIAALVDALGEEAAFAEELHHRDEHSIELAAVWLRYLLAGRTTPVVPILTGSFHPFTQGEDDAAHFAPFSKAIAALQDVTRGQRVLVVAAADLAHVGPAFGDSVPLDDLAKQRIASADQTLLDALCTGDPATFLRPLQNDRDARRICGLPPVYLTLRYLAGARGRVTGYRQCPADVTFSSLVSVAGVLLE